jgi:phage terminase small subunit
MRPKLTPKQKRFCQEYIIDFNGTQAAIRAGYSKKTASELAYEYLRKPHIQAAIQESCKKIEEKTGITIQEVVNDLVRLKDLCLDQDKIDSSGANAALKTLLQHLGGLSNKHEITGKDGGPIETQYNINFIPVKKK